MKSSLAAAHTPGVHTVTLTTFFLVDPNLVLGSLTSAFRKRKIKIGSCFKCSSISYDGILKAVKPLWSGAQQVQSDHQDCHGWFFLLLSSAACFSVSQCVKEMCLPCSHATMKAADTSSRACQFIQNRVNSTHTTNKRVALHLFLSPLITNKNRFCWSHSLWTLRWGRLKSLDGRQ